MFHLFAGQNYYPESGLGDYVGSHEHLEDAVDAGKIRTAYDPKVPYAGDDWYVVATEIDGRLEEVASGYKERD